MLSVSFSLSLKGRKWLTLSCCFTLEWRDLKFVVSQTAAYSLTLFQAHIVYFLGSKHQEVQKTKKKTRPWEKRSLSWQVFSWLASSLSSKIQDPVLHIRVKRSVEVRKRRRHRIQWIWRAPLEEKMWSLTRLYLLHWIPVHTAFFLSLNSFFSCLSSCHSILFLYISCHWMNGKERHRWQFVLSAGGQYCSSFLSFNSVLRQLDIPGDHYCPSFGQQEEASEFKRLFIQRERCRTRMRRQ